ncbi:hypothetical protein MRB53_039655 [Persea americana]|nr:hypothetical protein MRB53_039655 [Persea americana]
MPLLSNPDRFTWKDTWFVAEDCAQSMCTRIRLADGDMNRDGAENRLFLSICVRVSTTVEHLESGMQKSRYFFSAYLEVCGSAAVSTEIGSAHPSIILLIC